MSRRSADVKITAQGTDTIGEIAAAIAGSPAFAPLAAALREGTVEPGAVATLARSASSLSPDDTLTSAKLVSGESLVLRFDSAVTSAQTAAPGATNQRVDVVAASGPNVGTKADAGLAVVGRDPSCHLPVADPLMARQQFAVRRGSDGAFWCEPAPDARGPVRVDGAPIEALTRLDAGSMIASGVSSFAVRDRPPPTRHEPDAHGRVPFHRSPYFHQPIMPSELELVSTLPRPIDRPRFAYLAALAPLVLGVFMAYQFQSARFLAFAAMSPVMAAATYVESRRRHKHNAAESVERFETDLASGLERYGAALAQERSSRFTALPDLVDLQARAESARSDLWVRDRTSEDFLRLRVGLGPLAPAARATWPPDGEAEHRAEIERGLDALFNRPSGVADDRVLQDVPLGIDIAQLGTIGLVGSRLDTNDLAASLVLQACCWHSPEDLVVLAATSADRSLSDWLKWLPHTASSVSPIEADHVVTDKEAADKLLSVLSDEAARRADGGRFPWLLLVIDREIGVDPPALSRLLDACPEAGIAVLWLSDSAARVPRQANAIVDCQNPVGGVASSISYTDLPDRNGTLTIERLPAQAAVAAARLLAPLRDASSSDAVTAIPQTVTLFDALGTNGPSVDWVARRWAASVPGSLAAPIGATEFGPLMVDLASHGPHSLIGGTSGSGKSELLLSMVAAMAACHPPDKLNFLFIDYKGGASSAVFAELAHTVGSVTNLTPALAGRALTSLGAEIDRRMRVLAGRAKDLDELRALPPDGGEVPASLVIVIDEFATLVEAIPDFVKRIVDIAQRGRSLGVHLVLATQRPSGSVNENIKSNVNLRIALRMLDAGESTSVIGSPEAAAIPAPLKGRGYVTIGSGKLIAVQSAWSGAPARSAAGPAAVEVAPFNSSAAFPGAASAEGAAHLQPAGRAFQAPSETQLDVLVRTIGEATDKLGFRRGRAPWLEALPEVVTLGQARQIMAEPGGASESGAPSLRAVPFGIVDDPAAQTQFAATLDFPVAGGLLITGAAGSGKSSALRTLAVAAAEADASIVAIDFASRRLLGLTELPRCIAAVPGDDIEAVTRVISVVSEEVKRRRADSEVDRSAIVVCIDGLDTLTQQFDQGSQAMGLAPFYDALVDVLVGGRNVGVYPIVSTARLAGVRSALATAFTERVVLRQADASGYLDAGLPARDVADLALRAGQGFWVRPTEGTRSVQIARLSTGDESAEQAAVTNIGAAIQAADPSTTPALTTAPLSSVVPPFPSRDPAAPVVGVADLTLTPVALDLRYDNLYVQGEPRTGRSSALELIGTQVEAAGGKVVAVGPARSPLAARWPGDGFDEAAIVQVLQVALAATDGSESAGSTSDDSEDLQQLLLIDDLDLLVELGPAVTGPLQAIMRATRWIAAGPRLSGFVADATLQQAKKARASLYLCPASQRGAEEVLGMRPVWHPGLPMPPGRGILVADRQITTMQLSLVGHEHRPLGS